MNYLGRNHEKCMRFLTKNALFETLIQKKVFFDKSLPFDLYHDKITSIPRLYADLHTFIRPFRRDIRV